MSDLVIAGRIATMADGASEDPARGRVWLRDGQVVDVTKGTKRVAGFKDVPEVDVGEAFVLPGFIDMHNHLAYNTLPLWFEKDRTIPWKHNKHWPDADTYTESITEPAWVFAKACPEAVLAYVQIRAMAGGATAAEGWPTSNRGYQTVVRNVDSNGGANLIYTSVATKTGTPLAEAVGRMVHDGAGFIYHCAEGRRGERVIRDYTDLDDAGGLLKTFIGIHCTAVNDDEWKRWPKDQAGGVVWSPLSNLVLYGETTKIPAIIERGIKVCLGSDWGPSGTKNLLGEMTVARIASDKFSYGLTDGQIVEMVTHNPGTLLERCWDRPVGRLVPGAFADVTVLRGRGSGTPWTRMVAATERDVRLVVIDGVPRYGDAALMTKAGATPKFTMTVAGRQRAVSLTDPADPTKAWSWTKIMDTLREVQKHPQAAIANAHARAALGPRFADDAALELFLDMPDTRRTGRAGPPKDPSTVKIAPVPTIEHDKAFFDLLKKVPIHGKVLDPMRGWFPQ